MGMTPIVPTLDDQFPCVYLAKNRLTGLIYVGQAKRLYARWVGHKKRKHGKRLKQAMDEWGFRAFDFHVLERAPADLTEASLKRWLTEREQHYLDTLKPFGEAGYNQCRAADSTAGYRHTEEAKQRIREQRRLQTERGWVSPTLGTHRPESVKQAVSKANTGKVTHRRAVRQLDALTGELIRLWDSATEASRALGVAVTRIASVARGAKRFSKPNQAWYVDHTAGGFKWAYEGEMITGRWDKV